MYFSNNTYTFPLTIQSSSGGVAPSSVSGALYLNTTLDSTPISISGSSGNYFAIVTLPVVNTRTSFSIRITAVISGTPYIYSPIYGELALSFNSFSRNQILECRPETDPF